MLWACMSFKPDRIREPRSAEQMSSVKSALVIRIRIGKTIDGVKAERSGIVLCQSPLDVMDIGLPACGEERFSEVQHRSPEIAIKSVEIRYPKRTAVTEAILVLPVVRPVIAGILH